MIKDNLKMAYVFAAGDVKVAAPITEEGCIKKILCCVVLNT